MSFFALGYLTHFEQNPARCPLVTIGANLRIKGEEGTTTDTCKAKDDYMRVLLEGLDWAWVEADGHSLSWQVKDVNTGAVYDENTGLLDLDAKANGGIEAEEFGNYDWPAMMATFNEPGEYEITATFRMANGDSTSSSGVLHVE